MTRAERIERDRVEISELQSKYGLALGGDNTKALLDRATDLKLPKKILSPPKTVIPCSAELKDSGNADPCLIVHSSVPLELLPVHKAMAVGGQVISVSRSLLALPNYLIEEAWRAQGYWNGQPRPLLVSISGDYRYLVRQKSYFFRFEKFRGSDVDHLSPKEPEERDLKLNRYHWGSDLTEELTVVIADF
jgi:hypothetical protein